MGKHTCNKNKDAILEKQKAYYEANKRGVLCQ